ncbi:unnamed protein product [Dicrocoelium dendriticum]|nr:unnamed protein product [Dicrocoelium dendriticum]
MKHTAPETVSNILPLDKSLIDHRSYRYFQLENGLKVIVISSLKPGEEPVDESSSEDDSVDDSNECDSETGGFETDSKADTAPENKSAAALCIQVGSFYDPPEAQGLSHFLEHKYELSYARDSSRLEFFIGSLARPSSPYRLFGIGNMRSLKFIPEEHDTDIYSLLQAHRKSMYSSHRMTLAVHSKDTLDDMESLVRNLFSSVPNSNVPPLDFSRFSDSFDTPSFTKFYRVCPLGDREKLRVIWALPPIRHAYESCPMSIVSSLVGHEGKGSVLAFLKEKNLAVALACGFSPSSDFECSSICTLFIVYITLTEEGVDNINEVCRILFDYMKMLLRECERAVTAQDESPVSNPENPHQRILHTFDSYLSEYRITRKAAFSYSEPEGPEETSVHVANLMQLVPPEQVFSAYRVLKKVDLPLYLQLLRYFTPDRASIILLSGNFASSLAPDTQLEVEPWYKIRYKAEDISSALMQMWNASSPSEDLHLPYRNKFLTTNFNLLPADGDMKAPVDLNSQPGGECRFRFGHLWFQRSTRFKSPKAFIAVHFWSPYVMKSAQNVALHLILNYTLNQTLSTLAYEGEEANLNYTLEYAESGTKLCLHGFNEKLIYFYTTILDHIISDAPESSAVHFESYKEAVRQLFFNEALKPRSLNTNLQVFLLQKNTYLYDELLLALQDVSMDDLISYKRKFFSQTRITAYVHGNLTAEDAIGLFEYTTQKIDCIPLPRREFSAIASLAPGTYLLRVMNCNPADLNQCIAHVHLLGRTGLKRNTYNQLLAYLLTEPAFDYLRTKETLGYHVYLRCWRSSPGGSQRAGISLVACSQANQFSVNHVSGRMSAFWYRIAPRILAALSPEGFQTAVDSLITVKQLEDPNMVTEIERNWGEILTGENMFNRREASVGVLKTVKKEDLVDFFIKEYLEPANRKSLVIQVDAPSKPDTTYVIPPKSYSLEIQQIRIIDEQKSEEQRSSEDVDVPCALGSCGFDDKTASEFLQSHGLDLSKTEYLPVISESICIDDMRSFRGALKYDCGLVV